MRAECLHRRWRSLCLAATVAVGTVSITNDARAEITRAKPHSDRKTFDLTPPHPGESLANPTKGSGSPPRLKEFTPSATLHPPQNDSGERVSGATSAQESASPGSPAAAARPASAGPPVQPGIMQKQLSDQIAKLGIEGYLSTPTQGSTPGERQYWEKTRQEIAASLATWQALYDPSARTSEGPTPSRQDRIEAKP